MSCLNFMKKNQEDNKKSIDDFTISIKKCDLIKNKSKHRTILKHNNENVYMSYNLYNNLYNKDDCIICLKQTLSKDILRILKCNHTFHKSCIDTWFSRKLICPICMTCVF